MMKTYTTKEAAAELDVSEARIRQMIIDGSLEADRFGRAHVITAAALATAKSRKTAPGPLAKPKVDSTPKKRGRKPKANGKTK